MLVKQLQTDLPMTLNVAATWTKTTTTAALTKTTTAALGSENVCRRLEPLSTQQQTSPADEEQEEYINEHNIDKDSIRS